MTRIWNAESKKRNSLHLETTRSTTTTGLLELAALGADVGLLVLVRAEAKVLDSLAGVLLATDEHSVAASGGTGSELVKSEALTASSLDAGTGSIGESQSGNRKLGQLENSVVVGDGANNNDGLGSLRGRSGHTTLRLGQVDDARHRNGRLVDLGHVQAAEDGLVESAVSAAGQEAVELCVGKSEEGEILVSVLLCAFEKDAGRDDPNACLLGCLRIVAVMFQLATLRQNAAAPIPIAMSLEMQSKRFECLPNLCPPYPLRLCCYDCPGTCDASVWFRLCASAACVTPKTYLDQEQEVGVLALGSGTLTVLDVLLGDINTLRR